MYVSKRISFLVPYPLHESPSQRFRFEQYFLALEKNGHHYHVQSFLNTSNWRIFYSHGNFLAKLVALLLGFCKRFYILFKLSSYDFIFIHREVAPIGPPLFEWVIAKILRKKIIYDFDDAIWMTDAENESGVVKVIRWRTKVRSICSWSYKVSCGNEYLCSFARQFNTQVIYNPTTIDTENLHNPQKIKPIQKEKITIGWTGSHSTLKYLKSIELILMKLEQDYPQIEVLIIANQSPSLQLKSLRFLSWRIETEARDLAAIDIGIMPLPEDEWAKGKCGFKALQYMAMQIPTVASPVGVNTKIIDEGVNGILVSNQTDWYNAISSLIKNPSLRRKMGDSGRQKVIANYSVISNSSNFSSLFL